MADPITTQIGAAATKSALDMVTPDKDDTPREGMARNSDQARYMKGDKTAGSATSVEALIEISEDLLKNWYKLPTELKIEGLKKLHAVYTASAEKNLALRELRNQGQLDVFKQRETGYQQTFNQSETTLYNKQVENRAAAMSGLTGLTSLKGWIAGIALAVNEFMGGSLGDMPLMRQWKAEAEAFKINYGDIAKPKRADMQFGDQPDAQIDEKETYDNIKKFVTGLKTIETQKQADAEAKRLVPNHKNPAPMIDRLDNPDTQPRVSSGAQSSPSAAMFAKDKETITQPAEQKPEASGTSTRKPSAAAAMFKAPEPQPS